MKLKLYEILLQNRENWWEKKIALVYAENATQAEELSIEELGERDKGLFYTDGIHEIILPKIPKVITYTNLGD